MKLRKILVKIYSSSPRSIITGWRRCKSVKCSMMAFLSQLRINSTIKRLCVRTGRPIRVGFFIVTDSCFQLESVFSMMIRDKEFAPSIVVIPNMNLGYDAREAMYTATVESLKDKYPGIVLDVHNGDSWVDVSQRFDIVATMNPYDSLTVKYYRIEFLARKGIPVVLSRYYQEDGTIWGLHLNRLKELAFLWRFYQGNVKLLSDTARNQRQLALFNRLVAVGEPKIDRLAEKKEQVRVRKRIILAPHHSIEPIGEVGLQLSNFLQYADFILELPEKYPEIDWIFRPHPLLFPTMVSHGFWTKAEQFAWIGKMTSFSNVNYMTEGDYYDAFLNSDGMIQDCGSFLPEYFYVNKPQCYVLKSREHEKTQFTEYGQLLLQHVYQAHNKDDIISFVENVILGGSDPMEVLRKEFTEKVIKFNYPHASEAILDDLKTALGRRE